MCSSACSTVCGPPQLLRPGERAEALLAFDHRVAAVRAVALDAHAHVAEQPERGRAVGGVHRMAHALLAALRDAPGRRGRAVVEHRLAHDLHLHLALDALDDAHEQMVGVVVGRRARVARAVLVVVPGADRERIDHAQPALRRHPGRLDHVRARDVAAPGRHVDAVGADAPAAGAAVEHRAEHRRRVEVRQAHPLDRAVGGDAARRCGSPRGSRSRRSAGRASRARSARDADRAERPLADRPSRPEPRARSPRRSARTAAARRRPAGSLFLELVEVRGERGRGERAQRTRAPRARPRPAAPATVRRPSPSAAIRPRSRSRRCAMYSSSLACASHTGGPWPGHSTLKSSRRRRRASAEQVAGHRAAVGADEDAALAEHRVAGEARAVRRPARSGRRRARASRPPRRARSARRSPSLTSTAPRPAASGAG